MISQISFLSCSKQLKSSMGLQLMEMILKLNRFSMYKFITVDKSFKYTIKIVFVNLVLWLPALWTVVTY